MNLYDFQDKIKNKIFASISPAIQTKRPWYKFIPLFLNTLLVIGLSFTDFSSSILSVIFFGASCLLFSLSLCFYFFAVLNLINFETKKNHFLKNLFTYDLETIYSNLDYLKEKENTNFELLNMSKFNFFCFFKLSKIKKIINNIDKNLSDYEKKEFLSCLDENDKKEFFKLISEKHPFDFKLIDKITSIHIKNNKNNSDTDIIQDFFKSDIKELNSHYLKPAKVETLDKPTLDDSKELEVNDINYKQLL